MKKRRAQGGMPRGPAWTPEYTKQWKAARYQSHGKEQVRLRRLDPEYVKRQAEKASVYESKQRAILIAAKAMKIFEVSE